MTRLMRMYIYKCVVDDGGAPCVDDGLLTLTICKPYIRTTAKTGDLIFAFGSNWEDGAPKNRLVYIAEVTKSVKAGSYFSDEEFLGRQDCIYQWKQGRLAWRVGSAFHSEGSGMKSDLGRAPRYAKAVALVASDFRYFGRNGTAIWKNHAPALRSLVEGLGQGHRVNFTPELFTELTTLKAQTWTQYPIRRVMGLPLHDFRFPKEVGCEGSCVTEVRRRSCHTCCDEASEQPANSACEK